MSGQPASTVISPAAASMERTAVSPAGLSITPSVPAAGVKECPVPVILIASPSAAAFVTSAATSAAEAGTRTLAGLAVTFPAQFRQVDVLSVVIAARPLFGPVQAVAPNSAGWLSSSVRSLRSPATQIRTPAAPQQAEKAKLHRAP